MINGLLAIYGPAWRDMLAMRAIYDDVGIYSRVQAALADEEMASSPALRVTANGTAILGLEGMMAPGMSLMERIFFGGTDTNAFADEVRIAAADSKVKRILMRINSPGGSVSGLHELADTVAAAREGGTAIVAHVQGMAASAAFDVASQAGKIIASKGSEVGSIGTIMMLADTSKQYADEGIEVHALTTGEHKATGAAGVPITEDQLAVEQERVDHFFGMFIADVARGRGMAAGAVRKLADGRLFSAQDAKANGLIDSIGTFEGTLAKMDTPRRGRGK